MGLLLAVAQLISFSLIFFFFGGGVDESCDHALTAVRYEVTPVEAYHWNRGHCYYSCMYCCAPGFDVGLSRDIFPVLLPRDYCCACFVVVIVVASGVGVCAV